MQTGCKMRIEEKVWTEGITQTANYLLLKYTSCYFHYRAVSLNTTQVTARLSLRLLQSACYVPVNSKTARAPPPPGQTPGHLTFLKNFGQILRYVARLDGQMPHPLELQRGSNPPPSRDVKANCGNRFFKIFSHYEFLVQLVFAPHFKQRHIHHRTI